MSDSESSGLPVGCPKLAIGRYDGLRWEDGRILDPVRKRWVRLTPEEWVRQHVLVWLRDTLGVPPGLVEVERSIRVTGLHRRVDVLVRDRDGSVWMVIECKRPTVSIDQTTADQAGWYNATLGARFVLLTNGLAMHGWQVDANDNFRFLTELPLFPAHRT